MNTAILNRFTEAVIVEAGKYATIREAAEKNKTNMSFADMSFANMRSADMRAADMSFADMRAADMSSADMRSADMSFADMSFADMSFADMRSADMSFADMTGIKNYSHSHDIFQELIKREKTDKFTLSEWGMIGQILVHRLCWDSIKKRYGKKMLKVFAVLTKSGFGEFEEKYKEELKNA